MIRRLYPFLFGLYPLLFFYSYNQEELILSVLYVPIIVSLLSTGVLMGIFSIVFRRQRNRVPMVTAMTMIVLIGVYSFRGFEGLLPHLNVFKIPITSYEYLAVGLELLGIYGVFLVFKKMSDLQKVTTFFSALSIVVVAISVFQIGIFEVHRIRSHDISQSMSETPEQSPDIYYLVFDRYANQHVLEEHYNFDNKSFISDLQNRGFYVADKSYANYVKTLLSMTSSLNMDYLQNLDIAYDHGRPRTDSLAQHFYDNQVMRQLRDRGYSIIFSGDTWGPITYNHLADENLTLYGQDDIFALKFLETTLVSFIANELVDQGLPSMFVPEDRMRSNREYKFEAVKEVAKKSGPKFVYMHTLLPHDPYIFDKDCQPINIGGRKPTDVNYIEQLTCTSTLIIDLIDSILASSEQQPIIVLQSDEGPFKKTYYDLHEDVPWTTLSDNVLQSHARILNAYYLPGAPENTVYESISPVNSFRVIFNTYFDGRYELLPDEAYLTPRQGMSEEYVTITDKVRFTN